MKLRTTLILLAIAVGLFAYIRFYESNLPTTKESEGSRFVVEFDRDTIEEIVIKNDKGRVSLERDGVNWVITRPTKDNADISELARLFTGLEILQAKAVIDGDEIAENKVALKEYGVAKSSVSLRLKGSEGVVEVHFGSSLPVEGTGYYVKVDGDPNVYVVTGDLKEQVMARPDAFRDQRLTRLNVTEVEKIEIKSGAGSVEAVKDDSDWNLVRPLKARGDAQRIQDLAAQVINARILDFVTTDAANPGQYGLAEPRGTVTLAAQDQEKPTVLTIGTPVPDPNGETDGLNLYVTLSTRDAVLEVPVKLGDILDTKPNDLRDRNFVRLNPDIVDRLTISTPGGAPVVLARSGENWVVMGEEGTPANSAKADAMLTRIRNEKVTAFVSDVASELATYGLDEPRVTVTFSAYSSENTPESAAGESAILSVEFGNTENGAVYARVEDEPFIVALDATVLEDIGTQPGEWKTLAVFERAPEEIGTLNIQREGWQPVTLSRENGSWKSAEGTVDPVNVQSLVNTLAGLRAVRWVPETAEAGFEIPSLTIQFDDTKLLVGAKTDEDLWYGRIDGKIGTFLISKPDFEALALKIVIPPVDDPAATRPSAPPAATPRAPVTAPAVPGE